MNRSVFLATTAVIIPFSPAIAQSGPVSAPAVSDAATATAQPEAGADVPPESPKAASPAAPSSIVLADIGPGGAGYSQRHGTN